MPSLDYSKFTLHRTNDRGTREALKDAEAQALIVQVHRHREATRVSAADKRLARDIVFNYEGADSYLVGLQDAHGDDDEWMPSPFVARAILSIASAATASAAA